jgi:hypothetical protein
MHMFGDVVDRAVCQYKVPLYCVEFSVKANFLT